MGKQISEIEFSEEDQAIDMKSFISTLHYFDKSLVMGIELERNMGELSGDKNSIVARALGNAGNFEGSRLDTARAYKKANSNKFNVAYVKGDPSVNNGVEVIFGGCNERFAWIQKKLEDIEKELDKKGAVNFCRSSSNHISFVTLQDKLLSPIILKNIFNLTRVFSPALYWFGAGDPSTIHRGSHYCDPRFSLTPIGKSLSSFLSQCSKYSQCNLSKNNYMQLAGKEFSSGLYVEFRHIDGIRVPSVLTANAFILRALVYKALSLSRKGVLKVESMCEWDRIKSVTENILNRSARDSDINFVRNQAKELIDFLTPELKQMCEDQIPLMYEIASQPVYVRSGNWKQIEKTLQAKKKRTDLTENEEYFLGIVFDCEIKGSSMGQWKKKVAKKLNVSERMIEYIIRAIENKLNISLIFDVDIECMRVN